MTLLLLLLACTCREPAPPLTVLVLVDTLRADALGFSGASRPTSPHLDALVAGEAAWFARAYAQSSWTLSSTTSLLTGLHPWAHGVVRGDEDPDLYGRLPPEVPTLASLARGRGEASAAFINNTFLAPEFGLDHHFDRYDYMGATDLAHRSARDTVDAALGWLDGQAGGAFLLVHLMEPHYDYPSPTRAGAFTEGLPNTLGPAPFGPQAMSAWLNRAERPSAADRDWVRAHYDEEVLTVDAAIGALIEGLVARGRWEDATFVVTADHGEEFWDHGGFEHGHSLLSEVTQVPLVLKAPGVRPGRVDAIVDHVDLFGALSGRDPTLLALASGQDAPHDGLSFSQDILYGPQAVSVVGQDLRVVLRWPGPIVEPRALDAAGREGDAPLSDSPEARAAVDPLIAALVAARGHLDPTPVTDPREIEDFTTFDQLRALGYLDR